MYSQTNNGWIIRPARTEEFAELAVLEEETFRRKWTTNYTTEDLESFLKKTFSPQKIKSELEDRLNTHWVCEENGKLTGFVKVRASTGDAKKLRGFLNIELCRLYILEEKFGTGLGRALMQTALDYAIRKKFDYMWLGVWEGNARALKLYHSMGFVHFDEHEYIVGRQVDHDWLMKKKLS
jgi:ribosomal protein S18 acetylase RimI-like enzyme